QFAGIVMGPEEDFDPAAQLRIVPAFPLQRRRPLGRWQLGDRLKDALDVLKVNRHVGTPVPGAALPCVNGAPSCRKKLAESQDSPRVVFSQARAKVHFCRARYTDMFSAAATCSWVMPAKWCISATRAASGSPPARFATAPSAARRRSSGP